MDDDRLRRELERRATRAAVPDFVSEVAPRLDSDRAQPARVAPWAPLAGLAAAAVIVVAVVIAFPRPSSTPAASTPAPSVAVVEPSVLDCGQLPPYAYLSLPVSTVSVVDSTGLIDSCSTELRQGTWPNADTQAFVAGVPGQDEVEVAWNLQHCGPESVWLRVGTQGDKFAITLVVDRLDAGGVACVDTITSKHVVLHVPSAAVAGLSAAPVALAILAPSDDLTNRPTRVECSPEAGTAADAPHSTLYDDTHLVTSCEAVEPDGGAFLTATNPNGDERVVDVTWSATPCEFAPTVHVGELPSGYFVHGALPKAPCGQPAVAQALRLHLNAAIAASGVIVQFDRDGPTTSGQPPARVACTDAPEVTIVDVLGVIQSCAAAEGQVSPDEDIVASNPGGDKNALQISWLGPDTPCNYEVHLTKPDEHYQLDIYEMDDTCRQASIVRSVTLQLTTPIDAAQITGFSIGGAPGQRPSPSPPASLPTGNQLDCGTDWSLVLSDLTGLVASCDLNYDQSWTNGFVVSASEISASWDQPMCSGDLSASFQKVDGGYLLSIDEQPLPLPTPGEQCPGGIEPLTLKLSLSAPPSNLSVTVKGQQLPDVSAPSPSPTASSVGFSQYLGDGFSFDYPANWPVLTEYQHFGEHGPTMFVAVGLGSIDSGCTVTSTSVSCASAPIWSLPHDGILLAYHMGAWLGPIAPMPTPSLAPGEGFVDVGGRQAIFSQTPYNSVKWEFTDAPDLIEVRWGADFAGDGAAVAQAVIDTWHFDAGYQP